MLRLTVILLYFIIVSTSSSCISTEDSIIAPNTDAKALNQIPIQKYGCGPASLINSYRFGSEKWNLASKKIIGNTDKEKFEFIVKRYGKIFSKHTYATMRWDRRSGINALDLTDLANDFQTKRKLDLPKLRHNTHFIKRKKGHQNLLASTHKHLLKSLQKGFPPILSIKRVVQRGKLWRQIYGHFVVLYEVPSTLSSNATSFNIKYIDPWGGNIKTGTVKIPQKVFFAVNNTQKKSVMRKSPTLTIDFPYSQLGKHLIKKNEPSATILTSSITP